jgi:Carboxypeptidase regulatory-like domain/TonB dependent receptor
MRHKIVLLVLVFSLLFSINGEAQGTTATISGTVTDSSGAVVPGTRIVILNEETGISREVGADETGRYAAPSLGLGNYRVTASRDGFQTQVRSGITLTVGRQAVVNFELPVGSISETVEVTGEASLVETTKGGLGSLVESSTINDLPLNGRDLAQLITLQTGVVEYNGGDSDMGSGKLLVVSGARPTTNVFMIDGVAIESYTQKTPTGASGQFLGAEAVREFRVESNAYSAEFGRGTGGIFNVATKSGTNMLHGSLFEYLRNDNFDANRWEANKSGLDKPEFKRNQFGFSLGGPVKKDRTFFFGTYEGLRERLGVTHNSLTFSDALRQGIFPNGTRVTIAPTVVPYLQSSLWPKGNGEILSDGTQYYNFNSSQPTDENLYQVRLDHKLSDSNSFFGRYTYLTSDRTATANFPYEMIADRVRSQSLTFEHNWIISPTLLNTFRFGFSRNVPREQEVQDPPIPSSLYFVPGVPQMGSISINNGPSGVGQGVTMDSRGINSFQYVDDMTLTKGSNAMKWGVNINRVQFNGRLPARDAAQYSFASTYDFLIGNPNGRFRGSIFDRYNDPSRSFRDTIIGLYFQDDIHVTSRLTLNAGLRYEFITVPFENHGRVGTFHGDLEFIRHADIKGITLGNPWIENPSLKNFAPRVGFAWDIGGDGKTAIRGGAGFFFQQFDQSWYRTSGFRTPPFLVEVETTAGTATPIGQIPTGRNLATIPFPNIHQICSAQNPFNPTDPRCGVRPASDVVANKLRTPYVIQYNLNIQREILPGTVATIGYAGSRGIDLTGVANVNNVDPVQVNGRLVFTGQERPNPNFEMIRVRHTGYDSWYNSLQLNVTHRYSQGLQMNGSYTLSKNIDTISGVQTSSDTNAGPNTIPLYGWSHLYKGPSTFDSRHVFSFNSTYELPFGKGLDGAGRKILAGWQLGGIVSLRSGFAETVNISNRLTNFGVNEEFPDLAPGASNNPIKGVSIGCAGVAAGTPLGTPDLYYDPCAFVLPPANTLGNLGRNTLTMPGRATVDFSLMKNFDVTEDAKLQFRFEAFNVFNRVNFGIPARTVRNTSGVLNATAGRIDSTVGTPRQLQFALKLTF